MKRIGSIIVVITFFCFIFSSCGGEPQWKQTLSVLEEKLIKLEEIADKVKSGDEEAVKEAKKIVEEFMAVGEDQPELTGDDKEQAAKAAEELFEKYQTGVELLGADLDSFVEAKKALEDAYDDSQGVTASFNLNVLSRINDEMNADFNLSKFEHHSKYNEEKQRIEMYLRSLEAQTVQIKKADLSLKLEKNELIHTEHSNKYSVSQIETLLHKAGFKIEKHWQDKSKPYALFLAGKN